MTDPNVPPPQSTPTPTHAIRLPMLDDHPPERADAARNREALLVAAQELIDHCGIGAVTMDAVAARAGVGKGTVFRRFSSREGLMGALLNFSETAWQTSVISGPPPLGPGAEPWDRLAAFGRSRLETTLRNAELIRAAGGAGTRSYAAYSFAAMHVRHLLEQLDVAGDVPLLAVALMSSLEVPVLEQQVHIEGIGVDRVYAGWLDLAARIVRPTCAGPDRSAGGQSPWRRSP